MLFLRLYVLGIAALVCVFLGLSGYTIVSAASLEHPNVILVLTDDQGYGPMGCHGDPYVQTPHLDQLHSESARFTNFHVQPNCAPTRAMLLTGRPSLKNGVWATIRGRSLLRREEVTIADAFKSTGYKTAIFGKWHLGDAYPFRPQDRGFEETLIHGGGGVGNIQDYWANNYFDDTYLHNGQWKQYDGYCTDVWFNEAIEYIENNRTGNFFVYISTNAPHLPLVVEKQYEQMYGYGPLKEKPGVAQLYGMVTNIDDNIGRLRAKLTELNLAENTILIFMSDNGTVTKYAMHNAGMRGGKGTVTEGGHRVPFFLHWPAGGYTEGWDIDTLTSGMDLRPTLESLCNLKRIDGPQADGKNLTPLLRGETPDWVDRIVCLDAQKQARTPDKQNPHAIMQGKWRWTEDELHNLVDDPGQATDIQDKYPDVKQRLTAEYDRWWTEMSAYDPGAGREITIGSDNENPTLVTTHDISGEVAWNHDQVLEGFKADGYWDIRVEQDGEYEFVLARYPTESAAPIRGTIPVPDKLREFYYYTPRYQYAVTHENSQALPIVRAGMKIGEFNEKKSVPEKAASESDEYWVDDEGAVTAVKFRTRLNAGTTRLEAWFEDENGELCTSAYYVYVTRY
jgi:arylsulfatase A-like enzyme